MADTAFYGNEVFPKDLLQILQANFAMSGFPLDDPQFTQDLKELLGKYDFEVAQKPRRRKLILEGDFGKIM